MEYNFLEIEKKWKKYWQDNHTYKVDIDESKPKCYVLDMFPYPSGAGLHVGHPLGYIASDIYARYKRLQGYNVLHPMGFDSFGLPAEQYALETGQHPADTTQINIQRYKEQLHNIGFCFDWSREVQTSSPDYYKFTQEIFLMLYNAWYNPKTQKAEEISTLIAELQLNGNKNIAIPHSQEPIFTAAEWQAFTPLQQDDYLLLFHRLAYRSKTMVNWCPALNTVLANDEVVGGVSERGGHPVERKLMSQWSLRITKYADRLIQGLDTLQFPESLKTMQKNWIGKSIGAGVFFKIQNKEAQIEVFTTRPDTLFGVSFMVLAPELELVNQICTDTQKSEIEAYIKLVKSRSEIERMSDKKVSGVFTGAFALHPITQAPIPIYIADYVLAGYGTGAIMAVPAGDERDYKFAKHFNLPIPAIFKDINVDEEAYAGKDALLQNSQFLDNLNIAEAQKQIISYLVEQKIGFQKTNYKFRDAGFSRQRYWGEPFPISYDNEGKIITETQLPLALPHLSEIKPGPEGKGPLANLSDWVHQNGLTRETDTMPGYAGSSWYFLRYMDAQNPNEFCSLKASNYWQQVDVYVGGAEHAVGHLLYSRMWCKVLFDLGKITFDEPYKRMINQGMIQGNSRLVYRIKGTNTFVSAGLKENHETDTLYTDYNFCDGLELDLEKFKAWKPDYQKAQFILEDNKYICGSLVEKMSKRLYNVVNPDEIIEKYGADTFRMYEMFLGPLEMSKPWDTKGIEGVHRFIKKLWRLYFPANNQALLTNEPSQQELKSIHKLLKKVSQDIEAFAVNTSISAFMICVNELATIPCHNAQILSMLAIAIAPFAPHLGEELWQNALGQKGSVLNAQFPAHNDSYLTEDVFTYPVALNGKTRTEMAFGLDATKDEIEAAVMQNDIVKKWIEDKPVKKFIFISKKMINIVY